MDCVLCGIYLAVIEDSLFYYNDYYYLNVLIGHKTIWQYNYIIWNRLILFVVISDRNGFDKGYFVCIVCIFLGVLLNKLTII